MHLSLRYLILTETAYPFQISPTEKMCSWFSIVVFFDRSANGTWRSCAKTLNVS